MNGKDGKNGRWLIPTIVMIIFVVLSGLTTAIYSQFSDTVKISQEKIEKNTSRAEKNTERIQELQEKINKKMDEMIRQNFQILLEINTLKKGIP